MPRDKNPPGVLMEPCLFTTLAPELLHHIFSYLDDIRDVTATRANCSLLAAIGFEHLPDAVSLVYKRASFQRLVEIPGHTAFAKRIRRLNFAGARFDSSEDDYKKWDNFRADPEYNGPALIDELPDMGENGPTTAREIRVYKRAWDKHAKQKKGNFTAAEVSNAYAAYVDLVRDQERVAKEEFDILSLTKLCEGCPNLDTITLSFEQTPVNMKRAFAETMRSPFSDITAEDKGVHQLYTLVTAVSAARRQLDSLAVIHVSYRALIEAEVEVSEELSQLVSGLRRFRLSTEAFSSEEDLEEEEELAEEACESFESGFLRSLLSKMDKVESLNLEFPIGPEAEAITPFAHVFGGIHWPQLRELAIGVLIAKEDALIAFLEANKTNLQRLALSHIELVQGNWYSAFRRLGGRFPKLRVVRLSNRFTSWDGGCDFEFDLSIGAGRLRSRKTSPLRDAIENYLLNGGEWPDVDNIEEHSGIYPWEVSDYIPPMRRGLKIEPGDLEWGSDIFSAQA